MQAIIGRVVKPIILICIVLITIIITIGCCNFEAAEDTPKMFIQVERDIHWRIVYHRDTKVMYAVSNTGLDKGDGIFTLLVDAEGKPLLYTGE